MKICFIKFGFYSPKSVLTPLYEYSQILSKKGYEITLYVRNNRENIPSRKKLTIISVCNEYINSKITHIIFLLKLIFILKREKFDIIHIFNFVGVSLLPIFCKNQKEKWILDIQTGSDTETIKDFFYDKLVAFEASFFDKVIILNSKLKDKLFNKNPSVNIYIIPLGVNIKRFVNIKKDISIWQNYGFSNKTRILIYIGDLGKSRKLENMLKAFKIVLRKKINHEIKLVIIGGEKRDIERLKNKSRDLLLHNDVVFLGKVPYLDVPKYLVNSDIGLAYIPKNKVYNFQPPLKTLEYLAASLPVVATNTLGNLEIVKDGFNGLVSLDNYQDYAAKILKYLNNYQLESCVKNNALYSVRKYDWNNIISDIFNVYKEK
ncbi:MAG: glycosyltransferase family 4 protein [Promethearchaeota archaeon]